MNISNFFMKLELWKHVWPKNSQKNTKKKLFSHFSLQITYKKIKNNANFQISFFTSKLLSLFSLQITYNNFKTTPIFKFHTSL